MPLNEIAKKKLTQQLNEMIKHSKQEDLAKIPSKSSLISSMGEIFDEDEEWAAELFSAGVLTAVLSVYFENENLSDELKEKFSSLLVNYLSEAVDAISFDDWLKFHKSFRNLLWQVNKSNQ